MSEWFYYKDSLYETDTVEVDSTSKECQLEWFPSTSSSSVPVTRHSSSYSVLVVKNLEDKNSFELTWVYKKDSLSLFIKLD